MDNVDKQQFWGGAAFVIIQRTMKLSPERGQSVEKCVLIKKKSLFDN